MHDPPNESRVARLGGHILLFVLSLPEGLIEKPKRGEYIHTTK